MIQSVDVYEHLQSIGSAHDLAGSINTTYHPLDFGYDHGDHNHRRHGPVPSHMLFPYPTSPSHFGKGQDHDGPDMEVSKNMSLCEENANASDEKGDEQRQSSKTFFRRLNNVTKRKETKGEEC